MPHARLIAIGDVHGCSRELHELLQLLKVGPKDTCIFLGDLVNRGPDSIGVLEQVAALPKKILILGNHERRFLKYKKEHNAAVLKKGDWQSIRLFQPHHWALLRSMQLYHYEPELDSVFVHGGFLPHQAWREQSAKVITRIQVIDKKGRACKRSECPVGIPWSELWQGPPFVVYGHTPKPYIDLKSWSAGIDTGCVYGGALSALVLPSRKVFQVEAHQVYWQSMG